MSNRGPTEELKGYDKCEGDCEGCQGCPLECETCPSRRDNTKGGGFPYPNYNKQKPKEVDWVKQALDSDPHPFEKESEDIRTFSTGACRDNDDGKLDFEGFIAPIALVRYAEYMHKNRKMRDGSLRTSDNWQKGIPKDQYMKSLMRHVMDVWLLHRGEEAREDDLSEAICGILFNSFGMLYELLQEDKELINMER